MKKTFAFLLLAAAVFSFAAQRIVIFEEFTRVSG